MLKDLLTRGRVLMDGAMGTELLRRGARLGEPLAQWNLDHPDVIRAIHREYAHAGAELLLTNTFLARSPDVCQDGVKLAREARCVVLADLGPTKTVGTQPDFPDLDECLRLADALFAADGLLLETCGDQSGFELATAIERRRPGWPVFISFAFRPGGVTSFAGQAPATIARWARDSCVAALGVNCCDEVLEVLRAYRQETTTPTFARPSAGLPVAGAYPLTPDAFAQLACDLWNEGAAMVGGCCGTTPEHIRAAHAKRGTACSDS